MSKWRVVSLGEVSEAIFDGPHATPQKIDTGPIFLGISNLCNGRLDLTNTVHLSEDDYIKWTRRVTPRHNDLVFSYETRLGEAALIPSGLKCCLGRRMGLVRPDQRKVDPRFLLYAYLGPEFQQTIKSRTVYGSTVDRISILEFPNYPIALPSLPEQRSIACILGSLDDKIELNRQMNQTLEEMASTIFQSWFVDFDPVHAKARGEQPPGLDPAIANLFPDRLVQTKMGLVPEGWSYLPIKSVVNAVYDGPHATPDESLEGPVYLGIKNLTGTGLDFTDIRHISEHDFPRWVKRVHPQGGDIVFSYEAALGLFALIPSWLTCCLGRRIALVRPRKELNNTHFLFHTFIAHPFQRFLKSRVNPGSTVDRILLSEFPKYPILYPSDLLINAFEECITPMWNYIHSNQVESRTLAELRDTLLPKLMSGELRVPEAAAIAEEATT